MPKDKPPSPLVSKTRTGLIAVSSFDAEQLDGFPLGQLFDLKPRANRSPPLLRTYWKMLNGVVKATDLAATPKKLHRKVKRALRYVEQEEGFDGKMYEVLDSISFDAMKTDAEFRPYFDKAVELLCIEAGYDVLEWLEQ